MLDKIPSYFWVNQIAGTKLIRFENLKNGLITYLTPRLITRRTMIYDKYMLKNKTILEEFFFVKCPISPSLMSLNSNDKGKNKADVFNIFYTLSLSFVISIWGQSSKRMCLCLCLISIFFTQKWKTSFGGFSGGRSNAASSSSRCHVSVFSKNTYSEHCIKESEMKH